MFYKRYIGNQGKVNRNKICGVGINDANYFVTVTVDGKNYRCPTYTKWASMLVRVYSDNTHVHQPAYIGTSVCNEWLTFSNFAKWFESQENKGLELDKDIKTLGNKTYSPDNCLLVPQPLNALFTDSRATRGELPIGVCSHKSTGKYRGYNTVDGKQNYLGLFTTPEEAHLEYRCAKNDEIKRKMGQYPEFAHYLEQHMSEIPYL